MIILGLDTECTGVGDGPIEVIEFGGVLYHVESGTILASYSQIYKSDLWNEEAYKCHKISKEICDLMTLPSDYTNPWIALNGDMADFVVAHNAEHDHKIVTPVWPDFKKKPWLCTDRDLIHGEVIEKVTSHRLGHLCADYGINMGTWHRALADAEACARIAAKHDLNAAYQRKLAPRYRLITYGPWSSALNFREIPSVKKDRRKYQWDTEDHPKVWHKDNLLQDDIIADAKHIEQATKKSWSYQLEKMPPKPY